MRKRQFLAAILSAVSMVLAVGSAFAAAPVVTVSADQTVGPWPLTVQFTGSAYDPDGGSIVRYHWYFADGYTSEEQNPLHTYTCYGTFRGLLTVYDAQGETGTATFTILAEQVMFSDSLTLIPDVKYQKTKTGLTPNSGTVTGTAIVQTTEGYAVAGAVVQATWTTPSGIINQTATTDSSGAAVFLITVPKGGAGTYVLEIDGVAKTEYFFDSTLGSLSASVQI